MTNAAEGAGSEGRQGDRHRSTRSMGDDRLPKSSPDLNPIELPYRKFKAFLHEVTARTVPGLTRAFARSFHNSALTHVPINFSRADYASI